MTRLILITAVVLGVSGGGTGRADPLPEPLPVGTRLSHSLCETSINGPHAGTQRSLICELAGRPAVLIYADEIDLPLLTLLKKLDAVAEGAKEQRMTSSLVLLTTGDQDQGSVRELARKEELKATVLATTPKQRERPYFGVSPRRRPYYPHEGAVVTVILLRRLEVHSSYAFRKGELTNPEADAIVKAASTLPPGTAGPAEDAEATAVKAIERFPRMSSRIGRDGNLEGKPIVRVDLGFTGMTDEGLKELAGLKRLRILYLHRTEVTDAGLQTLAGFECLEKLYLGATRVTDEGLKELSALKRLQVLDLRSTRVTEGAAAELQKALPALRINLGGGKVLEPKP
jgi:hypothetical protein